MNNPSRPNRGGETPIVMLMATDKQDGMNGERKRRQEGKRKEGERERGRRERGRGKNGKGGREGKEGERQPDLHFCCSGLSVYTHMFGGYETTRMFGILSQDLLQDSTRRNEERNKGK